MGGPDGVWGWTDEVARRNSSSPAREAVLDGVPVREYRGHGGGKVLGEVMKGVEYSIRRKGG